MNIEVKRSIDIDDLLPVLKLKAETNHVGKMGKEVVIEKETLQDAIHVIEVLVKKNKQLRDINKNLNEKLEERNKIISELKSKVEESKCCRKGEQEKQKPEEEHTLQDVLDELEALNELAVIGKLIGIL